MFNAVLLDTFYHEHVLWPNLYDEELKVIPSEIIGYKYGSMNSTPPKNVQKRETLEIKWLEILCKFSEVYNDTILKVIQLIIWVFKFE